MQNTKKIESIEVGIQTNPGLTDSRQIILLMRQTTSILAVWKTEATEFPDEQEKSLRANAPTNEVKQ